MKKTVANRSVAVGMESKQNIGLTDADCICKTMAPHCPVHAVKSAPAPGHDVIR